MNGFGLRATNDLPQLAARLRVYLLGGFRVEVESVPVDEAAWQRRTAKALLKLMATEPSHALHREQILERLWPEVEFDSAVNSFSKALHAARYALEPQLRPRSESAYLRLKDDILMLDTDATWIDADHFQLLAQEALQADEMAAYEAALAAYSGELLPEDRYESWVTGRSAALADTVLGLWLGGAGVLQREGDSQRAVEWLQQVLQQEPTREDVHRRLMLLYVQIGSRHQALRQYQQCRETLERELDAEPEPETEKLYRDIAENNLVTTPLPSTVFEQTPIDPPPILSLWGSMPTPLVGRDRTLQWLQDEMGRAEQGNGTVILVSGEAGVGKTRLIATFAQRAAQRDVLVLWGTASAQGAYMPYAPVIEALEGHMTRLSMEERQALAARFPDLSSLLPSLSFGAPVSPQSAAQTPNQARLFPTIVCLLSALALTRPLLLVLSDLHAADSSTIQLLHYLARLAIQRHWIVVGSYREEDVPSKGDLRRMIRSSAADRLYRNIELRCLARQDCDQLVAALLPGGTPDEMLLDYVYSVSLGNPLFAEEVVSSMRSRDEISLADGVWRILTLPHSVPKQVRNLVEDTIGQLDENVQRVLALAALAKDEFSFKDLQGAMAVLAPPMPDSALLDALDRALEARILQERDNCYIFRHPLFRAALHEQMSYQRRAEFQAALANPYEPRAVSAADMADSLPIAPLEGETPAEQMAPLRAAMSYGELVDQLDRLGLWHESARMREKLANALMGGGRYKRALYVAADAARLYREARDQEGLARIAALAEMLERERRSAEGA